MDALKRYAVVAALLYFINQSKNKPTMKKVTYLFEKKESGIILWTTACTDTQVWEVVGMSFIETLMKNLIDEKLLFRQSSISFGNTMVVFGKDILNINKPIEYFNSAKDLEEFEKRMTELINGVARWYDNIKNAKNRKCITFTN